LIFLGRSRILFTHISETGEVPKWLPARSNDREGDPSQTTGQGFAKPLDRFLAGAGVRPDRHLGARSNDRANPSNDMTYTYFLLMGNNMVYTGLTNDLKRRFSEHQAGKVKSTKHRLPVKLIGYEAYSLQSDAQRRERFLKTSEGRALFRKQYRDILKKNWRGTQVVACPVE